MRLFSTQPLKDKSANSAIHPYFLLWVRMELDAHAPTNTIWIPEQDLALRVIQRVSLAMREADALRVEAWVKHSEL